MADYKVVDAEVLNAALDDLAESIRQKRGIGGDLAFPNPNEFKEAVDKINAVINGTKPETITSNGNHPTDGYSDVNVNVKFTTQEKTATPSRVAQTVSPDSSYDGLSKVTVEAIQHARISKTIGSSDVSSYSIPLSEIGFTPKMWGITMYKEYNASGLQNPLLVSLLCDMHIWETQSGSTSGMVLANGKVTSVGTSSKGVVNGNNFTFSGTYAYFAKNTTYRFFFWG